MKTVLLRVGLLLCLPGFAVSAAETPVRVAGSRDLRVTVVDTNKPTPARQAMYQAFAAALAEAVASRSGSPLGFKVKNNGADHAAFDLEAGVCDAVFVPSHIIPRPLAGSTVARISGTRGGRDAKQVVYLVYCPGDDKLAELLTAAFPIALGSAKFLEAYESAKGALVASAN
jgi:hypothetical protein